jgi:hypothetical protein
LTAAFGFRTRRLPADAHRQLTNESQPSFDTGANLLPKTRLLIILAVVDSKDGRQNERGKSTDYGTKNSFIHGFASLPSALCLGR